MKKSYKFCFGVAFGVFFLSALLLNSWLFSGNDIRLFQKKIAQNESLIQEEFAKIDSTFTITKEHIQSHEELNRERGILFFAYYENELVYWSDNMVEVVEVYDSTLFASSLIQLNNGYYTVCQKIEGNYKLVALSLIQSQYVHENKYLRNVFQKKLQQVHNLELIIGDETEGTPIYNLSGDYLFSLETQEKVNGGASLLVWNSILYLLAFLLFVFFLFTHIGELSSEKRNWAVALFGLFLLLYRFLVAGLGWNIPSAIYALELFDPRLHASSKYTASLGDFLVNGFFLYLFIYAVLRYLKFDSLEKKSKRLNCLLLGVSFFVLTIFSFEIFNGYRGLVNNTSFSLQIHLGSEVSSYTIWAYLGAVLFILLVVMFTQAIAVWFRQSMSLKMFLQIALGVVLLTSILFCQEKMYWVSLTYLLILILIQGVITFKVKRKLYGIFQILILLLSAVYLTHSIQYHAAEREKKLRKEQAVRLAEGNDVLVRVKLIEISKKWEKDQTLAQVLQDPLNEASFIEDAIQSQYFSGYWSYFDVQVTLCSEGDELIVGEEDAENVDCFSFFDTMLQEGSAKIEDSDFYELTGERWTRSYLGVLRYHTESYGTMRIYIRIDPPRYSEGGGYPALLVNEKIKLGLQNHSYAKYVNTQLKESSGVYDYFQNFGNFNREVEENYFVELNNYSHLIYQVDKDYKIVVSTPSLGMFSRYAVFPYVFILLVLFTLLRWASENFPWDNFQLSFFQQKIQVAFISVLMTMFLVLVAGALYYNYQQNKTDDEQEYDKKNRLLRREIFSNVRNEQQLFGNKYLEEALRQYSEMFEVDLNIYDRHGVLRASSRREIIGKGLMSERMNFSALYHLTQGELSQSLNNEFIGELEYMSAYLTIRDMEDNSIIAFLNIPYFMEYEKLKMNTVNLAVAAVSLSLLVVILALLITYFLSNRIIAPLLMIRERFSKVSLGKKNEEIAYEKNDEIQELVLTYNKMVRELDRNARLLAKSERESAWREMAKQVAHEIKNPLTPMKLNIQFAQRALEQKKEGWEEQFKSIAETLLTQIDELSSIASAFSDFAKMPKANKKRTDVLDIVGSVVELYSKSEIQVSLLGDIEKPVFAFIDGEQMRRVLVNLFLNAEQAMVKGRKGKIDLIVKTKPSSITLFIKDNGRGISSEYVSKIFVPNFTTKTSGTGLGLAMCKDIIDHVGGTIDFSTKAGEGTTFTIVLPRDRAKEKKPKELPKRGRS